MASEQTAIISVYGFNELVVIMGNGCVYYEVRIESLNVFQVNLNL